MFLKKVWQGELCFYWQRVHWAAWIFCYFNEVLDGSRSILKKFQKYSKPRAIAQLWLDKRQKPQRYHFSTLNSANPPGFPLLCFGLQNRVETKITTEDKCTNWLLGIAWSADNQTYSDIGPFWRYTISSYMALLMQEPMTTRNGKGIYYKRLLNTAGGNCFKRRPAQEESCLAACPRQGKKTGLKCRKVLLEEALEVQTSLELAKLSMSRELIFLCSVYCRRAKLLWTGASGCYLLFPEQLQ